MMTKILHISCDDSYKPFCKSTKDSVSICAYFRDSDHSVYFDGTEEDFTEWCEDCLEAPDFALYCLGKDYT